jgi:hypothetical protein
MVARLDAPAPVAARSARRQWRRAVSIGRNLAEARRQAGLTTTQVSQQTCIREAIIRSIESDDYTSCGGNFYARGHIRAIARVVGANPGSLIQEYDAAHKAQQAPAAADLFWPVTPVRLRERSRLNWSAVLALALVIVIAFAAYQFLSASGHAAGTTGGAAARLHRTVHHHRSHGSPPSAPAIRPVENPYAHEVVIHLAAVEDCWVEFTTPVGAYLSQTNVLAGESKSWTFRYPVDVRLGNPGGIKLTVDGKNPLPPGTTHPVMLSLGLHDQVRLAAG